MRRRWRPPAIRFRSWATVALVAGLLIASNATAQGDSAAGQRPRPGALAPDFVLSTLDGVRVRLSNFRGLAVVLVDFWAPGCRACEEEMPTIQDLYRRFKGQRLEVVAVSVDRDGAATAAFVRAHGLKFFPVVLDPDMRVARLYQVTRLPTHYLIDLRGVLRSRQVGPKDWSARDTWKEIEALLR